MAYKPTSIKQQPQKRNWIDIMINRYGEDFAWDIAAGKIQDTRFLNFIKDLFSGKINLTTQQKYFMCKEFMTMVYNFCSTQQKRVSIIAAGVDIKYVEMMNNRQQSNDYSQDYISMLTSMKQEYDTIYATYSKICEVLYNVICSVSVIPIENAIRGITTKDRASYNVNIKTHIMMLKEF